MSYLQEVGKIVSDDFEMRSPDQEKEMSKVFYSRRPSSLAIHFPNGNWLSTIWGWGAMNENGVGRIKLEEHPLYRQLGADTVECMYDCKSKHLEQKIIKRFGKNNPLGYMSFSDWLWLVNTLAAGRKK